MEQGGRGRGPTGMDHRRLILSECEFTCVLQQRVRPAPDICLLLINSRHQTGSRVPEKNEKKNAPGCHILHVIVHQNGETLSSYKHSLDSAHQYIYASRFV